MNNGKFRRGDYFFLPFTGTRRDLLIRLVRPFGKRVCSGFWIAAYAGSNAGTTTISPSGCSRCSPSLARRILGSRR